MSMVVKNNIAAQLVLGQLNKNQRKLEKELSKVSSGQKIIGAKDDASGYAISEKMREQIRSLTQGNQNVQNGSSMLKVAAGGVDNIVEELRNLKELAINAANDTNTDVDRKTMQKEFQQKMANINDIATMTNYNGKILLDGTYSRFIEDKIDGTEEYEIHYDGIYTISKDYSGTIKIAAGAKNVTITQEDPTNELEEVYIVGNRSGTNLTIENLNIRNVQNKNYIQFRGENNYLTVKGDNYLKRKGYTYEDFLRVQNYKIGDDFEKNAVEKAIINVGEGLTIDGENSGKLDISSYNNETYKAKDSSGNFYDAFYHYYTLKGAIIGSDYKEESNANITIKNIELSADSEYGAGIGSGELASIGNIILDNVVVDFSVIFGAGIGSGNCASARDIIITGDTKIKAEGWQGGAIIGSGTVVPVKSIYNGISSKNKLYDEILNSSVENIYIGDRVKINATLTDGSGIGTGGYVFSPYTSSVGDITISNQANINVEFMMGDLYATKIGSAARLKNYRVIDGNGNVIKNLTLKEWIEGSGISDDEWFANNYNEMADRVKDNPVGTISYVDSLNLVSDSPDLSERKYNFLTFQTGSKANQSIKFYVGDMQTDTLGISSAKVTTRENATNAIEIIDESIEYVLGEATYIGAYLQRLEYTDANITTMSENVQSSESTIRDADMAKEMAEYTKANVLTQAAQSMLAQANQNSSAVLNLLQ